MTVMQEAIKPTIADILAAARKLTKADLLQLIQALFNLHANQDVGKEQQEESYSVKPNQSQKLSLNEKRVSYQVDDGGMTRGERMAAALEMASRIESPLSTLDASAWQREIRVDRALPGREHDGD
ncbi:MAG: hypothetical protein AAF639_18735 [Chloroflexota bacterium]